MRKALVRRFLGVIRAGMKEWGVKDWGVKDW